MPTKVHAVVTYSLWSQPTRVPGAGVDGYATHGPTTKVPATGVDGHEPAVTVTSSLPRLHFRKLLDIRLEKVPSKVLQNRPEKFPQNKLPQIK